MIYTKQPKMPRKIKIEKNDKKHKSESPSSDVEIFEVESILDKRIIAGKVSGKKVCNAGGR